MTKPTYEEEITFRDAAYRDHLRFARTTNLLRLLMEQRLTDNGISHPRGLHPWQEPLVEDELNARMPPRGEK